MKENENCSNDPSNSPHDACILRYAGSGSEEDTDQKKVEVMIHHRSDYPAGRARLSYTI